MAQLLHHNGLDWVPGEETTVSADGTVSAFETRLSVGTPLRVVLAGDTLARTFVDFTAGGLGESVDVELPVEEGSIVYLSAVDPDGSVIYDSWFRLEWGVGDTKFAVELTSDESGVAKLMGAPPGRFVPYAGAPGWTSSKFRTLRVPRDADWQFNVTLKPARKLEGRCLRDGQPVQDFTIRTWQPDNLRDSVESVFRGRTDGSFSLEDAPIGWSRLVAILPGGERSAPEDVWISIDDEEAVEPVALIVEPGVSGGGSVVAAESGAAVEGASVRTWVSNTMVPIFPTSAVTRTQRDGTFAFPAPMYKDTGISVEAPGFATAWGTPSILPDGSLSFGQIVLYPAKTAHVIIESPTPLPPRTYYATANRTDTEELYPFPVNGHIELEGLGVGRHEVEIYRAPDCLMTIGQYLGPDGDWTYRVPALDSRALEFQLLGEPLEPERKASSLNLECWRADGVDYKMWSYFEPDRTARFAPLPDGEYSLRIDDQQGDPLYRSSFTVAPEDGDIFLSEELTKTRVYVHLTDDVGAPLVQAVVAIQPDTYDPPDVIGTDVDGQATFASLAPGPAEITVWLDDAGTESGIQVTILADEDTHVDVVLPKQRPLDIRAEVAGSPAAGLSFYLATNPGNYLVDSAVTDANGLASFPRCGSGRYCVSMRGNEVLWPGWQYVQVGDGEPIPFELFRRGSLHLEFLDGADASLPDLEFYIYHEELEYSVLESVDTGTWQSSTGALRTDPSGQVLLSGIPEGRYRVFLPGGKKSWKMGVAPGETTFETLRPHQE